MSFELVVNNKDNRVFMSRIYRSDNYSLEITSIFSPEVLHLGQMFVSRTSNFRGATISR